ncbi:MAG: hypothetical protein RBT33_00750 [Candidatus Dojkabacteria bacterium]|jgi:hypothetical protein|nr:hypothetical protein [Candidatus Dojkabacteria bacterium]
MKKISKAYALALQKEWENSSVSIEDLLTLNGLQRAQVPGIDTWKRKDSIIVTGEIVPTSASAGITEENLKERTTALLDRIFYAKEQAVNIAISYLEENIKKERAQYIETKEFKDIVTVIDTVERSVVGDKDSKKPSVAILVQKLLDSVEDDC